MTAPQPVTDPRCDLSDLPASLCGCRKHRPDGGQIRIDPAQDGRVRTAGHAYGPSIEAQHPGRCPACEERIQVGDRIRAERYKTIDGGTGNWVHAECVDG